MTTMYRTLKWPVIGLLITGGLHFMAEAAAPELKTVFTPSVLAPVLLAYGIWVGYRAIGEGGNFGQAILAGALIGLLPVVLDVFGFGLILGRGIDVGVRSGIFGFLFLVWGSIAGSGFMLSGASGVLRSKEQVDATRPARSEAQAL